MMREKEVAGKCYVGSGCWCVMEWGHEFQTSTAELCKCNQMAEKNTISCSLGSMLVYFFSALADGVCVCVFVCVVFVFEISGVRKQLGPGT